MYEASLRLWKTLTGSPVREAATAGVVAFVLVFFGTAAVPLVGQDESRFAQAAREMKERGELVVPTFAGEPRYDKPILIYWCTMVSYTVIGVSERAARLPSNLAGALCVVLLAWSARRRWGEGAGLLAGLLMVSTVVFHVQARASTADMVMLLPTLAAMLALERLLLGNSNGWHAAVFWLGMGFSVLAKGPVGPLIVLATCTALWALERSWRRWQAVSGGVLVVLGTVWLGPAVIVVPAACAGAALIAAGRLWAFRWWWGVPLALAVVAPWAVAAFMATEGIFSRLHWGATCSNAG